MGNPTSKPTLEDAIVLAAQLHKGQVDKAGVSYILHTLRVMQDPTLTSEDERIVAVLHDTVEDCDITLEQLRERGYSVQVVDALDFLTKLPEEESNYDAFIERVQSGPLLARKVKLADLRDNADLSRLANPTEKDLARQEKYRRAIAALESASRTNESRDKINQVTCSCNDPSCRK